MDVFGLEVLGDVMQETGKCHANHAKPPLWTVCIRIDYLNETFNDSVGFWSFFS